MEKENQLQHQVQEQINMTAIKDVEPERRADLFDEESTFMTIKPVKKSQMAGSKKKRKVKIECSISYQG